MSTEELKTSVQSGNKHLHKQLQEKWFQFMQQMPATDFKVLSLTAKNVLGTCTQSQPPVLVLALEVNHQYSYSKVGYCTPSLHLGNTALNFQEILLCASHYSESCFWMKVV